MASKKIKIKAKNMRCKGIAGEVRSLAKSYFRFSEINGKDEEGKFKKYIVKITVEEV